MTEPTSVMRSAIVTLGIAVGLFALIVAVLVPRAAIANIRDLKPEKAPGFWLFASFGFFWALTASCITKLHGPMGTSIAAKVCKVAVVFVFTATAFLLTLPAAELIHPPAKERAAAILAVLAVASPVAAPLMLATLAAAAQGRKTARRKFAAFLKAEAP